jgi:hypothetical protein
MTLVHAVVGVAAGGAAWWALRPVLAAPALIRPNYRGQPVATAAGLVVVLAVVVVAAGAALAGAMGWITDGVAAASRDVTVRAVLGFGFLGLVDDVVGGGPGGGFRGHLRALRGGRVTTGLAKAVLGAAIAVVAVAPLDGDRPGWLLVDAAVVALAANLVNLLDRAPGRALKATVIAFILVAVGDGASAALAGPAVAVGAGVALAPSDLGERCMLGDTGANALGAAVGAGVVLAFDRGVTVAVLVGLVALNVVSEWVSFSRLIDVTPPLRWVDRLGSRRGD